MPIYFVNSVKKEPYHYARARQAFPAPPHLILLYQQDIVMSNCTAGTGRSRSEGTVPLQRFQREWNHAATSTSKIRKSV
jgi:hypothetical protein